LIFWENVSPEATRALLNKKLFGYRANDKNYVGAVQKFGGQKLGKGCISVPAWNLKPIAEIFSSLNVQFKVMEVMELGEKTLAEE
jgi:hypothetical protein